MQFLLNSKENFENNSTLCLQPEEELDGNVSSWWSEYYLFILIATYQHYVQATAWMKLNI